MTPRLLPLIGALMALLIGLGGAPSTAQADGSTVTFNISSTYPNTVELKFFSQIRNQVWPGPGRVYVIDDWDTHKYFLSCSWGENICYGAWVSGGGDGTYWGVGQNNNQSCANCCLVCDGRVMNDVNLTP
jgi:hypothetical protein